MHDESENGENDGGMGRRLFNTLGASAVIGSAGCLSAGSDAGDGSDDGGDPEESGRFDVSRLDPVSPTIVDQETLTVGATVENTGEGAGTRDVEARVEGTVVGSQRLTLDPGSARAVSFAVETGDHEPGEYTYGVHAGDDRAVSTFTVAERAGVGEDVSWFRDADWEADPDAATDWTNYDVTEVIGVDYLMAIEVAPDGRVFYLTRGAPKDTQGTATAEVGWVDPGTGNSATALELDVQVGQGGATELGGQGIALDPAFGETGHVYVYYHPPLSEQEDIGESPYVEWYDGGGPTYAYALASRFEMEGDQIDPNSEVEIIRVPGQFDSGNHRGGSIQFGPGGNLYVSTGDESNSAGVPTSPRDDRVTSPPSVDAARSSGNTADLRGSILRIRPDADGGYSIPDGNLFPEEAYGDEIEAGLVKPEIFAMGFRNPFVISVDEHTGTVVVGDYAPPGRWGGPDEGPVGLATYHLLCEPGNAGWPFVKGYYPYRRYHFGTGEVGQPYWPDNLRNDSQNNTGLERLPEVTPATVWHAQSWDNYLKAPAWVDMPQPGEVSWPQVSSSGSANAGPVYRYSEDFGAGALDPYFEGAVLLMAPFGHTRDRVWYMHVNENGFELDEFLPGAPWIRPHEIKYGPDGRLFVMDMDPSERGGNGGIYLVEYRG